MGKKTVDKSTAPVYNLNCKRLQNLRFTPRRDKGRDGGMVKLKDIAQACGVSPATVSRALNGVTNLSSKNAAHICQVAKEMGYFPNAAARTLKTSRSYNIGILYEDRMDHEYFSLLMNELRSAAESQGYDLTFIRRSQDGAEGSYLERASRRNLDGVVVIQADFHSADVIRLAASAIPTVVIDHAFSGCDCVMNNNRDSVEEIVRAAAKMGHRKIAFIRGEDSTVTRERTDGFYKGCAEQGIRVPAAYIRDSHFHDPQACCRAMDELLGLSEPPTCVLCPDDFCCIGALNMLAARGVHAPRDISLVGYDGVRLGRMLRPYLTTYRQNAEGVALETGRLLLEAIEEPESHQPRQVVVSGVMVPGETLGPAPVN